MRTCNQYNITIDVCTLVDKVFKFKKNEHLKDKVAYLEHELAHVKNQN